MAAHTATICDTVSLTHAEVRAEIDRLMIERRGYFAGWLNKQRIPVHEVNDLLNDCYVMACLRVNQYRGEGTVCSWFFAILRHTFYERLSSRRISVSLTGDYSLASEASAQAFRQLEASLDTQSLFARARMSQNQTRAVRSFMAGEIIRDSRASKSAHHAVRKLRAAAGLSKGSVRCGR